MIRKSLEASIGKTTGALKVVVTSPVDYGDDWWAAGNPNNDPVHAECMYVDEGECPQTGEVVEYWRLCYSATDDSRINEARDLAANEANCIPDPNLRFMVLVELYKC